MCANIHYPEGKLTLGDACVREHKCESFVYLYYFDITVGNVIS